MSHSVSTAQKYYNIEDQARSDMRVASFLGSLVQGQEKEAEEKDCQMSEEDGEGEDKGRKDLGIVPDEQIQTVAIGSDNAAPICFVRDEQVQTFVTGPNTADHPTFKLEKEEKKELIRVFQDLLKVGRVPAKYIYNQRKFSNKILKRVRYDNALDYMTEKSKKNITSREKCSSWVRTGEIHQVAASTTSSCGASKYWTDLQAEVLNDATRHLPFNAKMSDIYETVLTDETCQDHHLTDIYNRQQIRDKFRNIAKKKKSM